MKAATDFVVTAARMEMFRDLSGDDNPLHSDPHFARSRGFPAPVVYGGLLVAEISRLLGTVLPGHGCVWQSLVLKFRNPLFVDQPARLDASVKHETPHLGISLIGFVIRSGGKVIAEGEAMALLPQPQDAT